MSSTSGLVDNAIFEFKKHHNGSGPESLIVENDVLVLLGLAGNLNSDIPIKTVTSVDRNKLAKPGSGSSLSFVLLDTGNGAHSVAAIEYYGSLVKP